MGPVREEYPGPRPTCLVPPGGALRQEGLPLLIVSLDQTFLGALQDKPQSVQIVQAAVAAQADAPSSPDKPMHHLPVPVGQFDARLGRQPLNRRPQLPAAPCRGRGEPRDCSNIKAAGPTSPKAAAHRPMVRGSRSRASATAEPVQPWASNRRAHHRSRSWGVGDRIIRRRKSLTPSCHCSRNRPISLTPVINPPSSTHPNPGPPQIYPIFLRISPWLWFRRHRRSPAMGQPSAPGQFWARVFKLIGEMVALMDSDDNGWEHFWKDGVRGLGLSIHGTASLPLRRFMPETNPRHQPYPLITVLKAGAPREFPNKPDRTRSKHSVLAVAWLSVITEIPRHRLTLHLRTREMEEVAVSPRVDPPSAPLPSLGWHAKPGISHIRGGSPTSGDSPCSCHKPASAWPEDPPRQRAPTP